MAVAEASGNLVQQYGMSLLVFLDVLSVVVNVSEIKKK